MSFWIITIGLAVAVAALLAGRLLRQRGDALSAADYDIAVYRDQLREVDRDRARGLLSDEAAERTRIEISRRILEADRARETGNGGAAPKAATFAMAGVAAAVLLAGSFGAYLSLGAPGYGDLPLERRLSAAQELRDNRPSQAEAEAQIPPSPPIEAPDEYMDLVTRLRQKVEERPDDPRGLQLLAANEANLGNFGAAYTAQSRLIDILGDTAPPQAYAELAEFYILAAGGYVSPEAETALRRALAGDPSDPLGRYYSGLLFAQTGRPDIALGYWRPLLENSAPDDPWVAPIRAMIEEVAARAGVNYRLPPVAPVAGLPGPSGDDMAAAAEMSEEDRNAMVASMVERLSDRLATEGGTAPEWARLIGALGVLGQTDRAQAIYDEARAVFAGQPQALAAVDAAARQAGLAQ